MSLDRQLRCVRRPGRRRRPGARLRAVLEAHRPPVRGRRGGPGGHRRGARHRPRPRARLAVAEGHPGRPVAALRAHPPDRPGRAGQGHQARSVRRVRPRPGRHRGPGAHLRARRAARRDPRAGGQRRRRPDGQGHRHRPRAAAHLALAEAGQRGRAHRRLLRPGAVRHGGAVRRTGQLHLPRGLRPGDQRVAARLRRPARGVGEALRRRAGTFRGAQEAARGRAEGRRRRLRPRPARPPRTARTSRPPATTPEAARSPPTRRSPRCARSSPGGKPEFAAIGPGDTVSGPFPLSRSTGPRRPDHRQERQGRA